MSPTPDSTLADPRRVIADLKRQLAESKAERDEVVAERDDALARETAIAEAMGLINSSPGDLAPVFDAMLKRAMRLCEAAFGLLMTFDGEAFRATTQHGLPAKFAEYVARNPTGWRGAHAQLAAGAPLVHVLDAKDGPAYLTLPSRQALVDLGGARSFLLVPLRRDERLLGSFAVYRQEVRPFTDKQMALLQNFASQAVIAMENARLLGELRQRTDNLQEALEYQTATSDVLKVISRPTFDLPAVLTTLVETAARLCQADRGLITTQRGEAYGVTATFAVSPEFDAYLRRLTIFPGRGTITGRAMLDRQVVHIDDLARDPEYTLPETMTYTKGAHTALAVPLMREGEPIGAIMLARERVEPFASRQIELVRTFADQAVIAMENARLLGELRQRTGDLETSLEYQTATSDVLKVISSSTFDLQPVLDALVATSARLCVADQAVIFRRETDDAYALVANFGFPPEYEAFQRERGPIPAALLATSPTVLARAARERRVIHVEDVAAIPGYPETSITLGKQRTSLHVPLLREGEPIGAIGLARQRVEPFTERQIDLVRTFADQAVIAIENARLITETREALEQQTATAEVLGVINASPGDLRPVFDAILEKAHNQCGAPCGSLQIYDGECFRAVADRGLAESFALILRQGYRPNTNTLGPQQFDTVQFDMAEAARAAPENLMLRSGVEDAGLRTVLAVPLRKDDETYLGRILAGRRELQPFTDKQIALLQNFAAQAVIAIENARLLTETREALEQQTATAEVLTVINSSPGDLVPVFDAMLDKALRLCGAAFGQLHTFDGERFQVLAVRGLTSAAAAERIRRPLVPDPGGALARVFGGELVVHIPDLIDTDAYRSGVASRRRLVEETGARTALWVALRKDDAVLGAFVIYRKEVRPFTDKQIALLQNFAAQAVVAIENARLITETREALDQQTATAEVLGVINSSPGDLAPVFDAMLEKAMRLCDASFGIFRTYDGTRFYHRAARGVPPAYAEFLTQNPQHAQPGTLGARVLGGEQLIHVADVMDDDVYRSGEPHRRALVDLGGARTSLVVTLRKEGMVLGVIHIYRTEVRPFTDKQIALLQNFAAQAVIAIENARLITETQQALEQQTATAEVLGVINSSPGDLTPVFDAMLEKATRLHDAAFGILSTISDSGIVSHRAFYGTPALAEVYGKRAPSRAPVGGILDRLINGERCPQVDDATKGDLYLHDERRRVVELAGARTIISVGLYKDDLLVGAISLYRREVRRFSEREIAVLENFAAQAVIAMENARLLGELQQRTSDLQESLEYQTATGDVLKVISESTSDAQPAFEMIVETAARLCDADHALIMNREGDGYRCVATFSVSPEYDALARGLFLPTTSDSVTGRTALEGRTIQITDIASDPEYRLTEVVKLGVSRTALGVPLLREGTVVGTINLARNRVQPFTEKQIELVSTFADQAVIALENARLITETREALEQQTATAEILRVISGSATDLQPVFDAIVERATKLCNAEFAGVARYRDGKLHLVATNNLSFDEAAAFHSLYPRQPNRGFVMGRAFLECRAVLVEDVLADPDYDRQTPHDLLSVTRYRTFLGLPIMQDGRAIGVIGCARRLVRPFSDAQIELLSTFADQAVIAIENARLLSELRDREAELRVTFDNMVDGVAMFDAGLHLAAWNRNFQELLDLPEEFLGERHTFDEYIRYLTERGEFGEADAEAQIARLRARLSEHYSFERTRPDGTVIEVRHNPMPDGGIVLIFSDITERKRSEAEIRAARDAAEAAYTDLKAAQANLIQAEKMASFGQLTAGIAHEIKNPLNFVNNFASLSTELLGELREEVAPALGVLDGDKREAIDETIEMLTGNLDRIVEHGQRADNIVKSMLEHSRGVTGERREVDLNNLVDEALNLAYHGARAQDASFNISLERDFDPKLGPIELAPQEITRVFLNLFGNGFYATAKRAREAGNGSFRPILAATTRDLGDEVEIKVRDNGTGIPPEIRDKLFQPFFTTKPTGEGTGLGLSISYDIVTQQHGGTISVESEPGTFTEFTVRLPRH